MTDRLGLSQFGKAANVRVFLTGATGYIGSVVAQALVKAGHSVIGLARTDDQARLLAAKGLSPHRGDLRDPASLAEGARHADAAIHTALAAAADTGEVDRAAAEAMIDGLSGVDRPFIYTSGCWVLGNTGDRIANEDTPLAPTPLVAWRPANEQLVLEAGRNGVRGIVVRPAMVYGRGGGLVASFTQSAREHGAARVIGNGENRWTFVHLDDLATLYVEALRAAAGTLLFAAHGPAIRVRDVAKAASRAAGADGKVETVPIAEARQTMGPFADALALDQQISGERAERLLGWRPQGPSVIEELARRSYS
jgi:nucleoside-diphosphate-sugar epimerase